LLATEGSHCCLGRAVESEKLPARASHVGDRYGIYCFMHLTPDDIAVIAAGATSFVAVAAIVQAWLTTREALKQQRFNDRDAWRRDRRADVYLDVLGAAQEFSNEMGQMETDELGIFEGALIEEILSKRMYAFASDSVLDQYHGLANRVGAVRRTWMRTREDTPEDFRLPESTLWEAVAEARAAHARLIAAIRADL